MPIDRRSLGLLAAALCVAQRAQAQAALPLELGLLPNVSARLLLAQYQHLREYYQRVHGQPLQLSTAPNWSAFHQRTLALNYDLVVTAANLARLAQLDAGYTPLLSYAPRMKGLLVFAAARPIQSVAELRGQNLAFSNPQSLVAVRGMQWLAENGLQRDRDFKTVRTPADDSVGSVVIRGDAIAAMLSGGEFRAMPEAVRAPLQVLLTFAEVPGFLVMASPKLGAAETRSIKERLLAFGAGSDEGKAFFASTGITALEEPAPGLMESLDAYVAQTRQLMTSPG
jgi:phosphonate transport system substrate-binding protein